MAGGVTMADLVRSTLRLRPDRIMVGEIRGAEALDMLKAWNTHPGGIATVHANSAASALHRIEQLVQESVTTVPRALIAEAIDLIIFIAGRGHARRVETVLRVNGLRPDGAYDLAALARDTRLNLTTHRWRSIMMNVKPVFACGAAPVTLAGAACPVALLAGAASASGTGMPWETPLNNILESVQGRSPRSSR
jgi:hypothetical protein